ncbi:hypothetical protein BH10PSE3_BH10PSE3_36320 [soil metagenome]
MVDLSLRTKAIEHKGRRFDIRVFRYDGDLVEAVPFENGEMARLPYPDGVLGRPLYQVSVAPDAVLSPAMLDSLIGTAEADIKSRIL